MARLGTGRVRWVAGRLMLGRYLREHLPLAGLLALFAGTFALVLSLYHLPT